MWDALEVTREGTNEVKQARINILNQDFKLFRMKHGETIYDMQKRFTYLINTLNALGNTISNAIDINKFLICFNKECKPKVVVVKEANNFKALDLTTLFGKLEKHEQDLTCLEKHEKEYEKKMKKEKAKDKEEVKKSISLKTFVSSPQIMSLVNVKKGMIRTPMMMMLVSFSRYTKGIFGRIKSSTLKKP